MTDDAPADPKPPEAAKPRRRRQVVNTIKDVAPFVGITVVWAGMSFVPGISKEGLAEGHGLLLLFAGLIQASRRNPNDA